MQVVRGRHVHGIQAGGEERVLVAGDQRAGRRFGHQVTGPRIRVEAGRQFDAVQPGQRR
jgi:hypothetical protein